jgi:hypothetical protein
MERVLAIAAVIVLLALVPGAAQMGAPPTPGVGTTSPLGTIVPTSPIGGSGIPLGATELFVGGLSPAPVGPTDGSTTCPDPTISGASVSSNSVIDSGATTGNSAAPMTSTGLRRRRRGLSDVCRPVVGPGIVRRHIVRCNIPCRGEHPARSYRPR